MTTAKAIFAGAVLIAAAIIFVQTIRPAEAQYSNLGLYQVVHHSNNSANASVFRLNTATGALSFCYIPGNGSTQVLCTAPSTP